jgi:TfoX/Sxy family transcriptional regulator of competence genes
MPPPSDRLAETLRGLLPVDERIVVRKIFGQPGAFVNGNLFAGTFGGDLFVRLSAADVERARAIRGSRPFEPMPGRPMKNYVVLPPALLRDSLRAREWVQRAVEFGAALPPKKTKSKGVS